MDREEIAKAVREVLGEMLRPGDASPSEPVVHARPRHVPGKSPFDAGELQRIKDATPARLVQGRVGTRYLTDVSIHLRAEHAIALDAVHSTVPDDFAAKLGCVSLKSQCKDHPEFLLYPNHGRRLDEESKKKLMQEGSRGADVQVILGDGLSAWAIVDNGPPLLPLLQQGLEAAGFKTGKPLFVKYARIGVADEVGMMLGCKSTVILVGERPGLGTGDSLSAYTAYGPKLDQDNAEKDCISNIRELGLSPAAAAQECVTLMKRTFAARGGGVHLTQSGT